jgi:hypothetical membrane protein
MNTITTSDSKRTSNSYRIGLLLWALCIQYYIAQVVVAESWKTPFSIAHNTISDLGNTMCRAYGSRYVCSPLHDVMNCSFVLLGILMMTGSWAIYCGLPRTARSMIGLSCIAVAGLGTMLVGFFPENTISTLHIVGAALPFAVGNIGLIVIASIAGIPRFFRLYAAASGIAAIVALMLFLTHDYLGLGIGGMERIVAYPQTIWLILFSVSELWSSPSGAMSSPDKV